MSAGLYTVAQVARFLGVRPQEAARMIEHEKLPALRLPGKQKPVRKVALHAFHGWLSARHTGEAFMTVEELASEIAAAQAGVSSDRGDAGEGGGGMRARCDERPEFTSRESRAARASRWLSGRVTLPGRGAGISTLRLMRDLRRDGPMAATARTGKRAGTGVRYPHAAMGNAVVNGWVKPHAGHFVLTVMGLDVLDVAACVLEEMDAVWAWVETGVGAVPATEPAEAGTMNGGGLKA